MSTESNNNSHLPPSSGNPDRLTGTWRERAEYAIGAQVVTPAEERATKDRLRRKVDAVTKIRIPSNISHITNPQSSTGATKRIKTIPSESPRIAFSRTINKSYPIPNPEEIREAESPRKQHHALNPHDRSNIYNETTLRTDLQVSVKPRVTSTSFRTHGIHLTIPSTKILAAGERVVLDNLPLEMFDVCESDKTPEEWLAINPTGEGTPARALYFSNRSWFWQPCHVTEYDPVNWEYTIVYTQYNQVKKIRRLGVLFDGEDYDAFLQRIEEAKQLRDKTRILCRYEAFIRSQPIQQFAPIQDHT